MISHRLLHSDNCFVADEVGANTSQKGDGRNRGERFVTEKSSTAKIRCSTKDHHFTLMGKTTLASDPVMCVVIFSGEKAIANVESGIDIFCKNVIPDESAADFFMKNSGKGKMFPGGPSCTFKGKHVPCFVRWSPSGSMTSQILREVVMELDARGVTDRIDDKKMPFMILDGRGSRMELSFLEYITAEGSEWAVCLGVPYGTSY